MWDGFATNKTAGRSIDFLGISDPPKDEKKNHGQAAARSASAKAEIFERERESIRGMSNLEKVLVESCKLQLQTHMQKSGSNETIIFSLNTRAGCLIKKISLAMQRAEATGDWTKYLKLGDDLGEANSKIEGLENTSNLANSL